MSALVSLNQPVKTNPYVRHAIQTHASVEAGALLSQFHETTSIMWQPLFELTDEHHHDLVDKTWDHLRILDYALRILSCRNILTEEILPDERANKRRRRKGKQELFSYHVLKIKPVGKKQESVPQDLWHNRIHLARGHFKTYTADAPLFGRITGRFWWQPQVRGRNKDGIIIKDYDASELIPKEDTHAVQPV